MSLQRLMIICALLIAFTPWVHAEDAPSFDTLPGGGKSADGDLLRQILEAVQRVEKNVLRIEARLGKMEADANLTDAQKNTFYASALSAVRRYIGYPALSFAYVTGSKTILLNGTYATVSGQIRVASQRTVVAEVAIGFKKGYVPDKWLLVIIDGVVKYQAQ